MSALVRDDYVHFCAGLRELCGLDLTQYRRPQMERRLRAYFERRHLPSLTDSLARLRSHPHELDELLERITINVSQLWRNPEQWRLLGDEILPELACRGRLDAWSAGCSYGAEAYTLAALCRERIPPVPVHIRGTDIDARMVERARRGVFSADDARSAPRDALGRFFRPVPEGYEAREPLRRMISFEVGDLLRITPRALHYDLIVCRNTVIYFTEAVRDELHIRLARALRAGGCLVVGPTERVADPAILGLTPVHPFIYRKA
jgi:chemotaxis protein methyltransferase CheR